MTAKSKTLGPDEIADLVGREEVAASGDGSR